ncbi:hypothetical protein HYS48_02280 [Candidatus Woesearchaeota archaeon]|nr:hypothetical protein [Candidatus Woesearchaeota archaeon]
MARIALRAKRDASGSIRVERGTGWVKAEVPDHLYKKYHDKIPVDKYFTVVMDGNKIVAFELPE